MLVKAFSRILIKWLTYPSSSLVVVQVDFLSNGFATFSSIDKLPTQIETIFEIIRTSSPFKICNSVWITIVINLTTSIVFLAITCFDGTLWTCSSYWMGHCCTCDSIDEGRLWTTCNKNRNIEHSECQNRMHIVMQNKTGSGDILWTCQAPRYKSDVITT